MRKKIDLNLNYKIEILYLVSFHVGGFFDRPMMFVFLPPGAAVDHLFVSFHIGDRWDKSPAEWENKLVLQTNKSTLAVRGFSFRRR